jgi:hypothetical protein
LVCDTLQNSGVTILFGYATTMQSNVHSEESVHRRPTFPPVAVQLSTFTNSLPSRHEKTAEIKKKKKQP